MLIFTHLNFSKIMRKSGISGAGWLMVIVFSGLSTYSQMPKPSPTPVSNAGQVDSMDSGGEEDEIAHPFFTHMGVPEGVGVYNLRVLGIVNRVDGATKGDFGFHLETGITKRIGLHIRNDSFLDHTRSEAMFQFLVIKSKDGMSGFAPIVEFEFPTRKGGGSRINTLVGFSTALVRKRVAFNQVVHYNPREDSVEGSGALVFRVSKKYFPVFELLAEGGRGERPMVRLVGGLKVRMNKNLVLGFAFQAPVTSRKDFSSQLDFAADISYTRKH